MKISKRIDPAPLRKKAYLPIGDQIDLIIKTFRHLKDNGVDIGPYGEELILSSEQIKALYPKSAAD